jgi:hypothetical protein
MEPSSSFVRYYHCNYFGGIDETKKKNFIQSNDYDITDWNHTTLEFTDSKSLLFELSCHVTFLIADIGRKDL